LIAFNNPHLIDELGRDSVIAATVISMIEDSTFNHYFNQHNDLYD
jgi:hypothetical protein